MTTYKPTRDGPRTLTNRGSGLVIATVLSIILLASSGVPVKASNGIALSNVQVIIQTGQSLQYSYSVTAYNSSGSQVAAYQSNYPMAAFELPSGTYLFTVEAYSSYNYPCIGCLEGSSASAPMAALNSTTGTTSGDNTTVVPIFRIAPSGEYGYGIEQISGPSSITIQTVNASAFPTTQVTIHVSYANGTVAQGAWVYASAIDDYYYTPSIVSSAQTGADGTVVLTMPQAPLLVTGDLSVPINLPVSNSSVKVPVGGQSLNITVPWQPYSIDLAGQVLILPPQTSGDITLQYQPRQFFYPFTGGLATAPGLPGPARSIGGNSTSNAEDSLGASIPSFPLSSGTMAPVSIPSTGNQLFVVVVASVAVVAAALIVGNSTIRGKHKASVVSA